MAVFEFYCNLLTRLTLSELGKERFSRNFRLSLAKRPEKPLVKTRPMKNKLLLLFIN